MKINGKKGDGYFIISSSLLVLHLEERGEETEERSQFDRCARPLSRAIQIKKSLGDVQLLNNRK
jgi:hypothetical protein